MTPLHDEVCDILKRAGSIALQHYRALPEERMRNKAGAGEYDPVTLADTEVEAFIRAELQRLTPDYGFLGEESGGEITAGECWILDPIDGTRAFVSGIPVWGTLLGLLKDGEPVAGWCYQPFTDELFFGDGDAAWLQNPHGTQPLRTSACKRVENAVMASTFPQGLERAARPLPLEQLDALPRLMRYGVDCYGYCMLAMGQIDLVIDGHLQPYDILPLVPIIRGAGGVVTDRVGKTEIADDSVIAACTPELHQQMLAYLKER